MLVLTDPRAPTVPSASTTSDNASAGPEILLASGGMDLELPGRTKASAFTGLGLSFFWGIVIRNEREPIT